MPFKLNFNPVSNGGTMQFQCRKKIDDGRFTRIARVYSGEIKDNLPNPEYLSLDAQLKSGIPPREINTLLLSPSDKQRYTAMMQFSEDYDKAMAENNAE